ncbi:MAG: trigger factor [Muribaculaceae bacterium]
MNVTFDKIDNVNATLTVSIEENDYQGKVTQELKKIGQTYPIKGFRPGHVPTSMLKKLFGKNVLVEVVNKDVYDALVGYIKDNKVAILGEPLIANSNEINFDADKDFKFVFELGLAPEINITVDKSVNIPYYNILVDDEMVARQDAQFTERFGKQVPGDEVDAKALVKGSMQELNEDSSVKEDGVKVEKTIVSPEYFRTEDQKALFMGKKVGDHVVFNPSATCDGNIAEMSSMLNVDKDKADIKSNFEMVIEEIIVLKNAEHGQELYDAVFGKDKVTSEEEYLDNLKKMISSQLVNDSNYRFSVDAEKVLTEQAGVIQLPVEFLKKWLVRKEDSKFTAENVDEEFEKMVPGLKWQLVKEQVAKHLDVKVDEADLKEAAKVLAAQQFAQYGLTNVPQDALERYANDMMNNEEYRRNLVERTVETKVFDAIKNAVNLENKEVTTKEFEDLFADK